MSKRASNFILAFFLLFGTVFCSVQPVGAWQCKGKVCGVSLWSCCCASPSNFQDSDCQKPTDASTGEQGAVCAAGCSCAMVITNAPDCDHAPPSVVAPFGTHIALAILPAPVAAYIPPTLTETGARRTETRGPPFQRRPHACPGLRAPPAS